VPEIVAAARQMENRVRDLYLQKALRKYAADRREEPSPHVVAALRRLSDSKAPSLDGELLPSRRDHCIGRARRVDSRPRAKGL